MNEMSPEPDSRNDDHNICETLQSDGGSRLEMIVDRSFWSEADITTARVQFRAASDATCQTLACQPFHIGVMLCGDARMRELNARFLGKDRPTNVLSFPDCANTARGHAAPIAGEVAICFETVRREAEDAGIRFAHHLLHLMVHALLHLAGHDHVEDAEAERMESLERRILAGLGVRDPYAGDIPSEPAAADGAGR